MTVESRIESLLSFLEVRDRQLSLPFSECGDDDRQEGGRFAPGNDCGGDGSGSEDPGFRPGPGQNPAVTGIGRTTTATTFPSGAWSSPDRFTHTGGIPGAEKIATLEVENPKGTRSHARESGIKSVAELLRFGAATEDNADVKVQTVSRTLWTPDGDKRLKQTSVTSGVPVDGGGRAQTVISIKTMEGEEPFAYYDYFQVGYDVKERIRIEKEDTGSSPTERKVGAKIIDLMLESLAAAEESGLKKAKTDAAGAPGSDIFQGYRLWGRFGFDATVDPDVTAKLIRELRRPGQTLMSADEAGKVISSGKATLQQVLSTKVGEKWWKQNGHGANMELDFTDKDSLGYKRFREFLDKHRRAKKRGEGRDYLDFIDFVRRSSLGRDLGEWPGFRGVERRDQCEKETDGKFAKGNSCGGGSAPKDKPLDASDPEAVKAFIAKMQKETGLDIHGKPVKKGSPRPSVDPDDKPKSLHQQRLEAAGKWSDTGGSQKHRDSQAKFQESLAYHDDIDPLKDFLRSSGLGWGGYAQQANEYVRKSKGTPKQVTKKEFNRKAAQAASQGAESFAKFLDEAGMVDLAKKLRGKKEQRNCGTGTGGFQKGNTCAGQAAKDVAGGAVKGAVTGAAAAVGKTGGFPPAVATGAAAGAAVGAVKGLYDNRMRPTRAGKAMKSIGTTDEQVASMVKGLGGSPKSVAEASGKSAVTLSVKDSKGTAQFDVKMTKSSVRIKPATGRQNLSSKDIKQIKKIAKENSPKNVEIVVDAVPTSTLAKIVKAGGSLAVDAAGSLVAAFVVPTLPVVAGTAIEASTGIEIEKTKIAQKVGEKILGNLPKRRG